MPVHSGPGPHRRSRTGQGCREMTPPAQHMASTSPADKTSRHELAFLYVDDETAWLEECSRLIRAGRLDALDYKSLASYLEDMAGRDRREIQSLLTMLISHLLHWRLQPQKRCRSWKVVIVSDRNELET